MSLFKVNITEKRIEEVYNNITQISASTRSFFVMIALSTTIAAYGLLSNSTAVVIGAMLVAPLMGAIFGIALGVISGDRKLLWKAVISAVLGGLLAVIIAIIIGLIPLRMEYGTEIMARTKPTLYDIIIALASGLAGAYALVNEKVSPALPGVAIATALVPPLATCGLCIATMKWEWATGAFLLFFANFLAIEIAAAFVFTLFGISITGGKLTIKEFFKKFWIKILILIFVGIFMTGTLTGLIKEQRFKDNIRKIISREINSTIGSRLADIRIEKKKEHIEVMATVLTHYEFLPEQVDNMEKILSKEVDPKIKLIIRSLISKDADKKGPVFVNEEELEQKAEEYKRQAEAEKEASFIRQVTDFLNTKIKAIPGARITDLFKEHKDDKIEIMAIIETPEVIKPDLIASMEQELNNITEKNIHLTVRSIITLDADGEKFIYQKKTTPKPEDITKLEKKLEVSLKKELTKFKGSYLMEWHYIKETNKILLYAVIQTPFDIKLKDIKNMEKNLSKSNSTNIELIIRMIEGSYINSKGYMNDFDENRFIKNN